MSPRDQPGVAVEMVEPPARMAHPQASGPMPLRRPEPIVPSHATDIDSSASGGAAELVGTIVGQYQLLAELASGGMGTVYRAKHELIDRVAAVKLLKPEFSANPEIVERFFNEARAATAIRHPGIVEVLDFGFLSSGNAYLVMEFLEGQTLSARLLDRGRLSEAECAMITKGVASALGAAHAKGIIHRDLKPDNVFLCPDPDMPSGERPKVLDFGIAKLADDGTKVNQTRTGTLMGTPAYMAPEQARAAGEIDPRADLYALGCMMYEMLTGATPFVAEGAGELIALQLFGTPQDLRQRMPSVSPEMASLVMRLLEKDPNARPQSAAEVNEILTRAIPSLTAVVTAVSAPATTMRPVVSASPSVLVDQGRPLPERAPKRKLGLVAGLGTLLVGAGVAAVVVMKTGGEARPPARGSADPGSGSAAVLAPAAGSGSAAGSAGSGALVALPEAQPVLLVLDITPKGVPITVTIDGTAFSPDMMGLVRVPPSSKVREIAISAAGYETITGFSVIDRDIRSAHALVKAGKGKKPGTLVFEATGAPPPPLPRPPGPTGPTGPSTAGNGSAATSTGDTPVTLPRDPGESGGQGPTDKPEGTPDGTAADKPGDKPGDKPVGEVGGMKPEVVLDGMKVEDKL
jgi:serine/threonine protein kinase